VQNLGLLKGTKVVTVSVCELRGRKTAPGTGNPGLLTRIKIVTVSASAVRGRVPASGIWSLAPLRGPKTVAVSACKLERGKMDVRQADLRLLWRTEAMAFLVGESKLVASST
jgi:hypothetical protein